ncbi:MAG TPA: substrate-binding domain-containing protein [Candidatus Brocadiia bacterium]|nr:substrate-binding domain-containing protein [Candidatus Brocadiia bacterium]
MKKASAVLLVLVLTVSALTGCKKRETQPAPSAGPAAAKAPTGKVEGKIGISVLTLTNPFFIDIVKAVEDEAKKNGFEAIVTSSEFDPAKQRDQVKDFIVKKVNAIILTPADSKAVGTAIKEANEAGIPVFTADIASLAEDAKVVSHIATDNYAGGRQAAKAMMEALGNKGKVAVLDFPVVESVILRTRGFEDELKESKSPIVIVGKWNGKGVKDEGFKVAQDILTAHKELDGIFAINDPSALGAYAALEKAGRAGKVVLIGFDGQLEGKKAILEGKIYADPIQFPDLIGRTTVQTIMKYLDGAKVEPQILIPPSLYHKADAEKDPALSAK